MAASMKTWIAGTAGLCVVVLGLGGFVLVKPQLDEASRLEDETSQLALSNDALEAEVGVLREQFASIDDFRAELAADRLKVPDDADLAALLREIDAQATAHGVALITSSPQEAATYQLEEDEPTTEPTAEATAESDAPDPAPSPSPSSATPEGSVADAVTAVLQSVDGMYVIPVTVDVVGDWANIQSFIEGLQKDTQRYFLLGTFTMTRLETAEAGKLPATTAGQIEAAMEVGAFVLTPADDVVSQGEDVDGAGTLPADSGQNPFDNGVTAAG